MRFLLLALVAVCCSCARSEPWEKEGEKIQLFDVDRMHVEEVIDLLERHGVECYSGGGSMGSDDMFVIGKEAAFKARAVIREFYPLVRHNYRWIAEVLIHEPDAEVLRVAEVSVESESTRTVVDLLESRGLKRKFYFGAKRDCILVPRNQVRDALAILREKPIPGVDVMPPKGF